MTPEGHWAKACRIENSRLAKLDPTEDYELLVWSCIHGGAHLLNAVLHHAGISPSENDYIRSDKLEPGLILPEPVERVAEALCSIEALGPRFVRGAERPGRGAIAACVDAYDRAKELARSYLDKPHP
jgi:hypothetical protein